MPRSNLEPHAEVLLALNKTCPEWTAQWLRCGLAEANGVPQSHRDSFAQNVLRERISKRRLCSHLQEFSLLCRQPTVADL